METHLTLLLPVFLLSSLLLLHNSHSATPPYRCHPDDYKVLVEINRTINLPNHIPKWVPNTDCCEWVHINCDGFTNRVNALRFYDNDISGEIPPAIADLPYLDEIRLINLSKFTGPLPRFLTKIKKLKDLRLISLNLAGPIPEFLSEIKSLVFLDLSFNKFTGSIPSSLSKLNLGVLFLSHNKLTGTVPKSLGNLDFYMIDLSRNKLVGDASTLFRPNGPRPNGPLWNMDLSRNSFDFDLSKVKFTKSLLVLKMDHNRIYGSIPKQINELNNILEFDVSYNRLCGEIPNGAAFRKFNSSSYVHNSCLCGSPLMKCK